MIGLMALNTAGVHASEFSIKPPPLKEGQASGKQVGSAYLLVPALNLEVKCEELQVLEGAIAAKIAKVKLLHKNCKTFALSKPSEEIPCHVSDVTGGSPSSLHITSSASLLPILVEGEPYVLADLSGIFVNYLSGTGCPFPLKTEIKGTYCALVDSNDTVEPSLLFSEATQKACKDKALYGINEISLDGTVGAFLTGANEGGSLGVSASAEFSIKPPPLKEGQASGKQVGSAYLLVPALNLEVKCEELQVLEGAIAAKIAKVKLLHKNCKTFALSKPSEEIPCHVSDVTGGSPSSLHITSSASLLPILVEGEPYVLADLSGIFVNYLSGTGCPFPLKTEIKGTYCALVDSNDTVEPSLLFSEATQKACKDKALYGINEISLDGTVGAFLTGANEGGSLGVSASAEFSIKPPPLKEGQASGKQVGSAYLLVPALNLEVKCEELQVLEGAIAAKIAKVKLLHKNCKTFALSKPSEEIPCHVSDVTGGSPSSLHITSSASLLPILVEGEPYVLADLSGIFVNYLSGTGCPFPLKTEIKGTYCALVDSNDTVEPSLLFSEATQKACKDKALYGINEISLDGTVGAFLTGANEGGSLGVS